jgi:hypothetical protein
MELNGSISYETFVKNSVLALRTEKSRGIHVLFSGFSAAFKAHYGDGVNLRTVIDRLVEQGHIVTRPAKKGIMIYLASDAPAVPVNALDKILAFAKEQASLPSPELPTEATPVEETPSEAIDS